MATPSPTSTSTAFEGHQLLAQGSLSEVALAVQSAALRSTAGPVLVFGDTTGGVVDLDLRGSVDDVVSRFSHPPSTEILYEPRGPGRPKLGVVAREITLLPRQWEWLSSQQRSASLTIRRFIEDAQKATKESLCAKRQQETVYRFMSAMAGNFAGFEEASRALFAGNREGFKERISSWPPDVKSYLLKLHGRPEDTPREEEQDVDPIRYLEPTMESGRALVMRSIKGPIVMLNLLRFREVADYSLNPALAAETAISGAEAYERYVAHTRPYLEQSGGEVLFFGNGGGFFIGPSTERWDLVILVRQASLESFFAFANNDGYRAGLGHRTAALEDSRLLPIAP